MQWHDLCSLLHGADIAEVVWPHLWDLILMEARECLPDTTT